MTDGFEERLHHDEDGKAFIHGSRQHICTNNEFFRKRSVKITGKIAEKIKDLPGVVAVQLDNEFKSHVGPCYCDSCKVQWQEWLGEKYHTVDKLNQAWEWTFGVRGIKTSAKWFNQRRLPLYIIVPCKSLPPILIRKNQRICSSAQRNDTKTHGYPGDA